MAVPLIIGGLALAGRILLPLAGRGALTAAATAGTAEAVTVGGAGVIAGAAAPVVGGWGLGSTAATVGGGALSMAFRAAAWSLRHPFKAAVAGLGVGGAADALTGGLSTEYVTGPAARAIGDTGAAVIGGAVNVGREVLTGRDEDATAGKLAGADIRGAFGRAVDTAGAAVERNGLYAAVPMFMALKMGAGGNVVQAVAVGAVIAGLVRLAEMAGLKAPGLSGLFNHAAVGIPADDIKLNPVLPHANIGYPPLGM